MSTRRLEGKVAIITGAASGIGEAAARLFAANGAAVVIADIQDQLGLEVVASIGPDRCSYRHCDVGDEEQVKAAVDYAVATYGGLDVVYSNAGISCSSGVAGSIVDLDRRELDRLLAVNVAGSALVVKHGARAMIARGARGSIVCTVSLAGSHAGYAAAAYTASKHGLLGLVRAAAGDLGPHGIRVNSVSPFMVATGMTTAGSGAAGTRRVEDACRVLSNLKGVVLKAADVAEAALFLASEESRFVSGHDVVVDGGTSVVYPGVSDYMEDMAKHKAAAA